MEGKIQQNGKKMMKKLLFKGSMLIGNTMNFSGSNLRELSNSGYFTWARNTDIEVALKQFCQSPSLIFPKYTPSETVTNF